MKLIRTFLPQILLALYVIEFVVLAINPVDRVDWWAENIPVLLVVFLLVITFKKFRFSNTAYLLMAVFLMYHTVGGHYTFERVPFDWFDNLIGSERNNFDRVGHFLVGVFAFPFAEFFWRKGLVTKRWVAVLIGVLAMGAWGALYEIIEWYYAVTFGGEHAANFLGSQGDIWDAQKDMLLDIIGGVLAGLGYLGIPYFKKDKPVQTLMETPYTHEKKCSQCGMMIVCADDACPAVMVCEHCGAVIR